MLSRVPVRGQQARGFTLIEMIFAVAIVAIVGSSVYVSMAGWRESRQVEQAHAFLSTLADSLQSYRSVTTGVGRFPGRLNHLTAIIDPLAAHNTNAACPDAARASCRTSCGATNVTTGNNGFNYIAANVTNWTTRGPFFHRLLSTTGTPISIGVVNDTLVRTPATAALAVDTSRMVLLSIQIDSVTTAAAQRLDLLVDGVPNTTAGIIQWTAAPVEGRMRIFWRMGIRGC